MRKLLLFAFCSALAGVSGAHASRLVGIDPAVPMLRWGTPVMLANVHEVNSKTAFAGQRIDLRVVEDVSVGGHVVIPRGTRAFGEVVAVRRRGSWGQYGRLRVALSYVRVGDRMVQLDGDLYNRGNAGTAGTVAAAVLYWPAGWLVTGTSAVLEPGTQLTGYVNEDVPLRFEGAAEQSAASIPASVAVATVPLGD